MFMVFGDIYNVVCQVILWWMGNDFMFIQGDVIVGVW